MFEEKMMADTDTKSKIKHIIIVIIAYTCIHVIILIPDEIVLELDIEVSPEV